MQQVIKRPLLAVNRDKHNTRTDSGTDQVDSAAVAMTHPVAACIPTAPFASVSCSSLRGEAEKRRSGEAEKRRSGEAEKRRSGEAEKRRKPLPHTSPQTKFQASRHRTMCQADCEDSEIFSKHIDFSSPVQVEGPIHASHGLYPRASVVPQQSRTSRRTEKLLGIVLTFRKSDTRWQVIISAASYG
jgi:hypothetical protein